MSSKMILHCGGYNADFRAVQAVQTPAPNGQHFPMDHEELIEETIQAVTDAGLEIVATNHALVDKPVDGNVLVGARYFGLMDVRPKNNWDPDSDHGLALGLRNTHDKSYAASLVAGTRVFVCDNLGFSGEVMLSRRHTRHISRDLPRLVTDAFGKVIELNDRIEQQIAIFKTSEVKNEFVHDVICKAVRTQALPGSAVTKVLGHWYDPEFEAFMPRTAWSCLNAFTEVAKEWKSPDAKAKRTMRIHTLLAQELGIAV